MPVYNTHLGHRRGMSGRKRFAIGGSTLHRRPPPRPPDRIDETMAMDIQGRKPTAAAGKQFRSEFWAWRPIHALIVQLCPDMFDRRILNGMATGGGGGPLDQS